MPQEFRRTSAVVLALDTAGENSRKLTLLSPEHGLFRAHQKLANSPKNQQKTQPADLFDLFDGVFEAGKTGNVWFVREYHPIRRFRPTTGTYQALEWASRISATFIPNLTHLESYEAVFPLLDKALEAIAQKPFPEASYLKALYLFARQEGYGVERGWLAIMSPKDRDFAISILTTPLETLSTQKDQITSVVTSLEHFLAESSDIVIPGSKPSTPYGTRQ